MKYLFIHIIHIALSLLLFCASNTAIMAQEPQTQPLMPGEKPKPTKYVAIEEQEQHIVFFQGFTLSADVYGPVAYMVSDYGTMEGALRLNLKNTFFPIIEAGYGKCSKEDFNTKISYKVNAPYGRIGIDFNMLKDKFQHNRLYLGARYGLSVFKYDISGPPITDPIWGGSEAFNMKNNSCTSHWVEAIFGVEVRIVKNFHMGWAVRYKRELSSTKNDFSKPNCIPGYGYTTNATCWGATYNLIFDLNWGMKKSRKRGINVEIRDIPTSENEEGEKGEEGDEKKEEEVNEESENNETKDSDNEAGEPENEDQHDEGDDREEEPEE